MIDLSQHAQATPVTPIEELRQRHCHYGTLCGRAAARLLDNLPPLLTELLAESARRREQRTLDGIAASAETRNREALLRNKQRRHDDTAHDTDVDASNHHRST